jgi:hypothetical protein
LEDKKVNDWCFSWIQHRHRRLSLLPLKRCCKDTKNIQHKQIFCDYISDNFLVIIANLVCLNGLQEICKNNSHGQDEQSQQINKSTNQQMPFSEFSRICNPTA